MKVSVIVPVYNMTKYLPRCMDTLLGQSLDSYEVICVDDGSDDGSLEMLREYEKKDSRVKVITQKNQYAGIARNNGMKIAVGDYIGFVDPDDFIHQDMYRDMYEQITKTNADMCACTGQYYHDDTGEYSPLPMIVPSMIPKCAAFKASDLGKNAFRFTTSGPVNKLFRRSFIEKNNIHFADTRVAEDLPFICLAEALAEKITIADKKIYYNYRIDSSMGSLSKSFKWPLACAQAHTTLRESLIEKGVFGRYKAAYENFVAFEVERYARRYSESPEAFAEYHKWYHEAGRDIYDIHISSMDAGTLSNLLMTFDGADMKMSSEAVRNIVLSNSRRFVDFYRGHEKERIRMLYARLKKIEGNPKAAMRIFGFAATKLYGRLVHR